MYNLLKMVQLILSSMDSDEVNDIEDTVESRQVVDIIEQTFNDLASQQDWPEFQDFFELTPSGDPSRPTLMTIPDGVMRFDFIKYDCSESGDTVRDFRTVRPLDKVSFFDRMNGLNSAEANIYQYDYVNNAQTFDVRGKNNDWPQFYTVLADKTVIFDNYRLDLGSTLIGNRTMGYGSTIPAFIRSNTFIAPFDAQTFSQFYNEAKSQCFLDLKQVQNSKADQRAREAKLHYQNNRWRSPERPTFWDRLPNYGRRSGGYKIPRHLRSGQ